MARRRGGGRKGRRTRSFERQQANAAAPGEARPQRPGRREPPQAGSGGAIEGKLQKRGEFGFVLSEVPGVPDLYVSGRLLHAAMEGDRVRARETGRRGGRRAGEIVAIVERAKTTVVGRLRRAGPAWSLELLEGEPFGVEGFGPDISPTPGTLAVARVTRWPEPGRPGAGIVIELLGSAEQPRARVRAAVRELELPDEFPEAVRREAARFGDVVPPASRRGREDLTGLTLFTIDGSDAKDFDDAVSLEHLPGGALRLGVHIADVSSYVLPGSAIDREAFQRATSVYLPGRVIPMLPPNLSDHLCSLMPQVERLAYSCFLDLDGSGHVRSARFAESVIRSRHRLTYEEVDRVLLGGADSRLSRGVHDTLRAMGRLQKALTTARLRRGALDFDMPEYKIEVDMEGRPVSVSRRARLASHRLVEEFMILANEAAARTLIQRRAPAPHRVHGDPDPRKLAALGDELEKLGLKAPPGLAKGDPQAVQTVLRRAEKHPLRETMTVLTVRSLKQAVYSDTPARHFGLASKAYTHFTSPIRRYPDLMVHRALKAAHGPKGKGAARLAPEPVGKAALHCSAQERLAAEAERKTVDLLRAEYLRGERDRVLRGTVTRSMPYGCFVELEETGMSGLVRGLRVPLGTKLSVRVERVDEMRGLVDLKKA